VIPWANGVGCAAYAILSGSIEIHKEWMARAYVVTFAFVTFRVLNDYFPGSRRQPDQDRILGMLGLPLLVTEVILQLRRMRSTVTAG
jgi:hypothetical protein